MFSNRCLAHVVLAALVLAGVSPLAAKAQWSSDTTLNLSVADGNGEQVQAKVAPSSDGGSYISWFDSGGTSYRFDTWTWSGTAWTNMSQFQPGARSRHSMAYDSVRNRTVVFGGIGASGLYADTWEWNNAAWTQINGSGPSARESFAMAYDAARGTVVLFGGLDGAATLLGDTWTYDGTAWTQLSPGASPSARKGHSLAYDSVRQVVVLFGGEDAGGKQADTWEWNGTTWAQVTTATAPTARSNHASAFDLITGKILLFGGSDSGNTVQNDTWLYNGVNWALQTTATSPAARSGHGMASGFHTGTTNSNVVATIAPTSAVAGQNVTVSYNPVGRPLAASAQVFLHYGYNNWATIVGTDAAMVFNAGAARWQATITLPAHLGQLDLNFNDGLGLQDTNTAADWHFDVTDIRVVIYGGNTGTFNTQGMFEWNGFNWVSRGTGPSARNNPAMAYDATAARTVLFGGIETGGYDVRLQRLNAKGIEQWPHNGILICDRSVSSTVDYQMVCDASGNAVIAFNDDRFGPAKVTVQKVNPAGVLQWNGIKGVQAGDGSTTGSPPSLAALSDGGYGVIWSNTLTPVGTIRQKLDSNGALLWGAGGMTQNDTLAPQRPLQSCDVQAADNGGMIAWFVRCAGTNCATSNKQLYTQKYDSAGAPLWNGGAPLTVMGATSSIQTGYFPRFLSDGSGGAVLGWYEITTAGRNAYIQHVLADGTLKFPAPISNVGPTNPATRIRVGAGVAYNQTTGEYFLASPETDNATQAQNSVLVQRYSSAGVLLWGDSGVTLLAITNTTQPSFVQAQIMGDGVSVYYMKTTAATTRQIAGAHVDGEQTITWNVLPASNGGEDKARLTSGVSACGYHILAFGNGSTGSGDIRAQNVRPDGTFGNPPPVLGDMDCDGLVDPPDMEPFVQAMLDPAAYALAHPCCDINMADMNVDLSIDGLDIADFVTALLNP